MHTGSAAVRIAARVFELRESHKLTREALAASAREHGAPANFTATVLRYIENSRSGAGEKRSRNITVDELLWLAAALEMSPLELVDDELAPLFAAPSAPAVVRECQRCARQAAGVLSAVKEDIEEFGDLVGVEPSLAATALRLAETIDDIGEDGARLLPALTKELRATLKELVDGRVKDDDDDDADLATAV